jgi:hypothetical protein
MVKIHTSSFREVIKNRRGTQFLKTEPSKINLDTSLQHCMKSSFKKTVSPAV